LVYCAHEYTLSNLRFAQAVEPQNPAIAARITEVEGWRATGRISLPSSLQLERATNPFLRCQETSVKQMVASEQNIQSEDTKVIFAALRAWKDHF
jgi:hydroxyacylglutathione hydrolase